MSRLCGLYMLTVNDRECEMKFKHTWSCIRCLGSAISLRSLILSVFSLDTCDQTESCCYSSIIYNFYCCTVHYGIYMFFIHQQLHFFLLLNFEMFKFTLEYT